MNRLIVLKLKTGKGIKAGRDKIGLIFMVDDISWIKYSPLLIAHKMLTTSGKVPYSTQGGASFRLLLEAVKKGAFGTEKKNIKSSPYYNVQRLY